MKISRALLCQTDITWVELSDGYKMHVVEQEYGGIKQRWALIYSEQAYQRELITLQ